MIAETVCAGVAAGGLGVAVVTAYRKRYLAAARVAGYALVPLGLAMTGIVGWLADTALSPTAWAGFGVLGVAWLLFSSTRAVERRRGGARGGRGETQAAPRREAVAPPAPARGARPVAGSAPRADEDFSDIEAILKKHGI